MTQSKSIFFTLTAIVLLVASCKKDLNKSETEGQFDRSVSATTPDNRLVPATSANIPNVINTNTFLSKNTLWILNGPTFVTNGATLTIEAGAFIKGQLKTATANNYPSFLLVTRGSKLIANGTAADPIVFTSINAANARAKGNWGGIVLLGNGTTNVGEFQIEGVKGVYAHSFGLDSTTVFKYGNTSDADNSGSLKNVRIEFAGDIISEGNELNGLTLGGVGYNTCLENIQISHGADDGFEFFGGAVNAKNLISYANDDDDFDFDQGYVGNIQFAVALKYPSLGLSSSPNSIESNNVTAPVVTGGPFASKRTRPTLSNFTLLGRNTAGSPQPTTGALFRAGSAYNVRNFAIGGFNYGADLSGGFATGSEFSYSVVHGFLGAANGLPVPTNYSPFTGATANTDLKLLNPFNLPNPNFNYSDVGATISPVKNRANFTSWPGSFSGICLTSFTTTTYAGAFPANAGARWDATWSSYSALTNPYTP